MLKERSSMDLGHIGDEERDLLMAISAVGTKLARYDIDVSSVIGCDSDKNLTVESLRARHEAMAKLLRTVEGLDAKRAADLSVRRRWVAVAVIATLASLAAFSAKFTFNRSEAKDDQCADACPVERP